MSDTTPLPAPPPPAADTTDPTALAAQAQPATPQRTPPLRLEIAWLTVVVRATAALLSALRPPGDGVGTTLAGCADAFRTALGGTPSFATLALLRAQLAADMMFLVAYGLLLRASIQHAAPAAPWPAPANAWRSRALLPATTSSSTN